MAFFIKKNIFGVQISVKIQSSISVNILWSKNKLMHSNTVNFEVRPFTEKIWYSISRESSQIILNEDSFIFVSLCSRFVSCIVPKQNPTISSVLKIKISNIEFIQGNHCTKTLSKQREQRNNQKILSIKIFPQEELRPSQFSVWGILL